MPTKEIWERVEESLKAVGMYEYRKHSPNKLSGGQKQRVSIAGVIAMHPKCIVLDEPTAMLDPKGRKEVIRAVRALNEVENITVVLITHYMEEVEQICTRIAIIDGGRCIAEGTKEELKSMIKTGETITVENIFISETQLSEINTIQRLPPSIHPNPDIIACARKIFLTGPQHSYLM